MKKLLCIVLLSFKLSAVGSTNLVIDPYFSPESSAETLLFMHHYVEKFEDWLTSDSFKESQSVLARLSRLGEQFFIWQPLNHTAMLVQHEIAGHGYRVRSYGPETAWNFKYKIGVPPPYGRGSGYAAHYFYTDKINAMQTLAIDSAGMEATSILGHRIKMKWLQRGKINPKQVSMFLKSRYDITEYIYRTPNNGNSYGDVAKYVQLLNNLYPEVRLSIKDLKKRAWINLIDPFTFNALYSLGKYIWTGQSTALPQLRIRGYNYLPSVRLGFTPFGLEYYWENYFIKSKNPLYIYLKQGRYAKRNYGGFGFEKDNIWAINDVKLGIKFDAWLQPYNNFNMKHFTRSSINEFGWSTVPHIPTAGCAFFLTSKTKLWSKGGIYCQVGAKTAGFLPGESLQPAYIGKIGITLWE